jgi:SAM-dependent methyltransferase/uncharacterized protein YbaR (Trm112 family)
VLHAAVKGCYKHLVRRVILNVLQCPRCRVGSLSPDADVDEIVFGPVRCRRCDATFPVAEGVVVLLGDRVPGTLAQRALETPLVARSYDRYLRKAMSRLAGVRVDVESQDVVQRSLLGTPTQPVLDLGCGTGALTRRLARVPDFPPVVGMDVSKPMLEEAIGQAREATIRADFVRAAAPELPFGDRSLGAVILEGTLPLLGDQPALFAEVARVLVPRGRFVATLHLPGRTVGALLYPALGLRAPSEEAMKDALTRAGFYNLERVLVPPLMVLKAERAEDKSRNAAAAVTSLR